MQRSYLKLTCHIKVPNDTYYCVKLIDMRYLDGRSQIDAVDILTHNIKAMEKELTEACVFLPDEWKGRMWEATEMSRGFG